MNKFKIYDMKKVDGDYYFKSGAYMMCDNCSDDTVYALNDKDLIGITNGETKNCICNKCNSIMKLSMPVNNFQNVTKSLMEDNKKPDKADAEEKNILDRVQSPCKRKIKYKKASKVLATLTCDKCGPNAGVWISEIEDAYNLIKGRGEKYLCKTCGKPMYRLTIHDYRELEDFLYDR